MNFTEWIAGGLLLLSLYLSNGDIGEIGVTGLRTRTLNADLRSPQNWTATFALRFAPHSLPPRPHWVRVGVRRRYYTLSGHQRQTHSSYALSWAELYQRVETFCSVPGPISSSASAAHVHDAAKMHAHRLHRRTGVDSQPLVDFWIFPPPPSLVCPLPCFCPRFRRIYLGPLFSIGLLNRRFISVNRRTTGNAQQIIIELN